jgi:hypothetical protein
MIRIGTTVRLKPRLRKRLLAKKSETAKVKARLDDIEGGLRLDRPLDGFTFWNVKDLERVSK